ncbi:protein of unknown function [Xenorhabdus poinarii G6]|uniref:Uncharacterized protein n=1 Tax=Xenorhabdus poinarii G6 TaxID=1354304 RepID=A0A068QYK6_9GAMM|nr:protein of unknown function [Xenorhabdus poinarii G6]
MRRLRFNNRVIVHFIYTVIIINFQATKYINAFLTWLVFHAGYNIFIASHIRI